MLQLFKHIFFLETFIYLFFFCKLFCYELKTMYKDTSQCEVVKSYHNHGFYVTVQLPMSWTLQSVADKKTFDINVD